MKYLYLIRHGEAEISYSGISDFSRELTQKGVIESTRLGNNLKNRKVKIDGMFFSTAYRAESTAKLIMERTEVPSEKAHESPSIYNSTVGMLYEMVCSFDNKLNTVAVVGHNPTLTYFLEYITGESDVHFNTAGCAVIEFDVEFWMEVVQGIGYLKYTENM